MADPIEQVALALKQLAFEQQDYTFEAAAKAAYLASLRAIREPHFHDDIWEKLGEAASAETDPLGRPLGNVWTIAIDALIAEVEQ